jgi:nitroreductase
MTDGITMTNAVIECILSRSAAKYYDPAATLSDDQICELVRIGPTAPTSFQLQNWRFIAVRTLEAKARLRLQLGRRPPAKYGKTRSASARICIARAT